jgi:hypothetical protein
MMTPAARSLQIFGLYLIGAGSLLLLARGCCWARWACLRPPTPGAAWPACWWPFLGIYYLVGARAELLSFMRATVWVRASVIVVLGALVAAGLAPPPLMVFGIVDLAAAVWTALALRSMGAPLASRTA